MAGFDFSDYQTESWELRPFVDVSGFFIEPSEEQVNRFFAELAGLVNDLQDQAAGPKIETDDPDLSGKVVERLADLDEALLRKLSEGMLDAYAAVLSNSPSRENLAALPYRPRQAFYGYVMGWLRPEAGKPATNG